MKKTGRYITGMHFAFVCFGMVFGITPAVFSQTAQFNRQHDGSYQPVIVYVPDESDGAGALSPDEKNQVLTADESVFALLENYKLHQKNARDLMLETIPAAGLPRVLLHTAGNEENRLSAMSLSKTKADGSLLTQFVSGLKGDMAGEAAKNKQLSDSFGLNSQPTFPELIHKLLGQKKDSPGREESFFGGDHREAPAGALLDETPELTAAGAAGSSVLLKSRVMESQVIDGRLAAADFFLHPSPDIHPFFRLLVYFSHVNKAQQQAYTEAVSKIREMNRRAEGAESLAVRYAGRVFHNGFFPWLEDVREKELLELIEILPENQRLKDRTCHAEACSAENL